MEPKNLNKKIPKKWLKFFEKETGVKVDDADIVTVHRIPGKAGKSDSILVKIKI